MFWLTPGRAIDTPKSAVLDVEDVGVEQQAAVLAWPQRISSQGTFLRRRTAHQRKGPSRWAPVAAPPQGAEQISPQPLFQARGRSSAVGLGWLAAAFCLKLGPSRVMGRA